MQPIFTISFLFLSMAWIFTVSAADQKAQQSFDQGRYEQAKSQLESVSSPDYEDLLLLGKTHMELSDAKNATNAFEKAVAVDPTDSRGHYWLGRSYGLLTANASVFKIGGYAKKSLAGFEQALVLKPDYLEAHQGLIQYYLNAPKLFGGGKEPALEQAKRLSAIDSVEGQLALADVHIDDDEEEQAQAILLDLVKTQGANPRALLQLGFMSQRNEDYAQAHTFFSQAAETRNTDLKSLEAKFAAKYQVGRTAVLSGENTRAGISAYKDYLAAKQYPGLPEKAWAHYRLGTLYQKDGDSVAAQEHFELARVTTDRDLKRRLAGL